MLKDISLDPVLWPAAGTLVLAAVEFAAYAPVVVIVAGLEVIVACADTDGGVAAASDVSDGVTPAATWTRLEGTLYDVTGPIEDGVSEPIR